MDKHEEVTTRLQRIFEFFLEENFVTTNTVYFEKLLTHLAAKENAYVLQAPFAMEWVDKCIQLLSENFDKINCKVTSFMLNFCSILASNEWIIIQIRERQIINRVIAIIKRDVLKFNPSIKLGSIRLVAAISRYSLGLAYIRNAKAWQFLIKYCNKDHTLYVVREARQLLYELIYKFSVKTNDEQIVLDILNEIVKPILDNVYQENKESIIINVDDAELQHKLAATLDLISYVLQQTLESEEKTNLAHLCEEHYNLELSIWKLSDTTQNSYFLEKILTALTSLNFAKLVYEKWDNGQIVAENFNKFGITFFNMMKFCISRGECYIFIKLAELNHVLWKKLGQRAPKEIQIENECVRFENQLISFHLLPVLFLLKSKAWYKVEIFDNYIMKLFEISCEQTMRICYAYRDLLYSGEPGNAHITAELAYKSIHGILSMEHILERDQAVLVFQAMVYALKEFVLSSNQAIQGDFALDCIGEKQKNAGTTPNSAIDMLVEIPNVLYAALIALQRLIKVYKITWKESIETICLVNFVAVILDNTNLTARLVVQALKLQQLAIEHFLSPNMALLVNNLQGSGLVCLGPIIIKRFHDPSWEVRDSTLEFATSIAHISYLKFPAFQRFLGDYKICPVVYEMAVHDSEAYVRSSALKCLSEMIKINFIWENDLSQLNLIEHLFYVLYNESEGIVRKEAIITLAKIYEYRKIPNQYKDILYSTLSHCVVNDLYWEVKVNALRFWELEFEKQFTNQGMIDGTFPTVTFSREYKKIVTLTEKEIELRIMKVFNELSQRGCLGVMLKCLNEECDAEVVKAAVCMVKRLFEKLKNYDYATIIDDMDCQSSAENTDIEVPPSTMPTNLENTDVDISKETNADEVITSILDAQDINLLAAAYQQKLQLNGIDDHVTNDKKHINEDFYKQFTTVSAKHFIKSIKEIDLNQLLTNQHEWFLCSESFVSLLDDIYYEIKRVDERISADCY